MSLSSLCAFASPLRLCEKPGPPTEFLAETQRTRKRRRDGKVAPALGPNLPAHKACGSVTFSRGAYFSPCFELPMARVEKCVNSQREDRTAAPSLAAGLGAAVSLTPFALASTAAREAGPGNARRLVLAIASAVSPGNAGSFISNVMSPAGADTSEHHGRNHPE